MNLMKKIALIVWAMAWLIAQAAKHIVVTFVSLMRNALGENGEPVSVITFIFCLAGSVVMVGFTGMLIAAFRVN